MTVVAGSCDKSGEGWEGKTGRGDVMGSCLKALDLFGGRDRVVNRMTSAVRDKLKDGCSHTYEELEKHFNLRRGVLEQIKNGQKKLNVDLFERLRGALGLSSIYDVLGPPDFNGDGCMLRSWEAQRKLSPMHVVAPERGQGGNGMHDERLSLAFYVTLRAIGELHKVGRRRRL
jgi:hypothetical protein